MMIIMNLVVGLCILLGGIKYKEQEYNAQGTLAYFSMIVIRALNLFISFLSDFEAGTKPQFLLWKDFQLF